MWKLSWPLVTSKFYMLATHIDASTVHFPQWYCQLCVTRTSQPPRTCTGFGDGRQVAHSATHGGFCEAAGYGGNLKIRSGKEALANPTLDSMRKPLSLLE